MRLAILFLLVLAGTGVQKPLEIKLTCDDLLRFGQTEIRAAKGQVIRLELKNVGKIPALKHNFVLLAPGINIASFGNAAQKAAEQDFIPADMADKIIAHTSLIGSGEKDTITFTLEESGVYPFICSYPGHQAVSRGVIIIE